MLLLRKQQFTMILLGLVAGMHFSLAQKLASSGPDYPENSLGSFASAWFEAVNANTPEKLEQYNLTRDDWDEYFQSMIDLVKNVGGLGPEMVSYHTSESIAIYAREGRGQWVRVYLGLNAKNEILQMSIKKSFIPEDYALNRGMTKAQVRELVTAIGKEFEENYIAKSKRTALRDFLMGNLEAGNYNAIDQGDLLAITLTKDLVKFANDKHLQVIPPSQISEVQARFGLNETEDSELETGAIGLHETASKSPELEEVVPISGKMLDSNIAYIKVENFRDSPRVAAETERLMNEFQAARAMIIDLTQSGGGDASATNNLLRYFFDQPMSLNDQESGVKPKTLSKFYTNKPLYVLTSRRSISAAEAFSYFLQQTERATLIGETTAGAGYRVDAYKLPFDFYLVNSIGSSFDPDKNEGWQGRGVKPDVETSAKEALAKALTIIQGPGK